MKITRILGHDFCHSREPFYIRGPPHHCSQRPYINRYRIFAIVNNGFVRFVDLTKHIRNRRYLCDLKKKKRLKKQKTTTKKTNKQQHTHKKPTHKVQVERFYLCFVLLFQRSILHSVFWMDITFALSNKTNNLPTRKETATVPV